MALRDKEPSKSPRSSFVLAAYCWAHSLPLGAVCFPRETPLKKTNFSFASGYQLMVASGLGMGGGCPPLLPTVGLPSSTDPWGPPWACSLSLCEFIREWILPCLKGLLSLVTCVPSGFFHLSSAEFSEPWGEDLIYPFLVTQFLGCQQSLPVPPQQIFFPKQALFFFYLINESLFYTLLSKSNRYNPLLFNY